MLATDGVLALDEGSLLLILIVSEGCALEVEFYVSLCDVHS
jgi:hypothetical protein